MQKTHVAALRQAIDIVGNQVLLAEQIRAWMRANGDRNCVLSQQNISHWLRKGTIIDPKYWPAFEAVTKNVVTRERLNPAAFVVARKGEARAVGA